jgi:hypothetical protein
MNDRVEELNGRLYERNVAAAPPPLLFSPRPLPTKYQTLPILDEQPKSVVPLERRRPGPFIPGAERGSQPGYSVDAESDLINIVSALQRDPRAVFVPSSSSSLYNLPDTSTARSEAQPHPRLFSHVVAYPNVAPNADGAKIFYNAHLRTPSRAHT